MKQSFKKVICFTLAALISGCVLSKQENKPTTSIVVVSNEVTTLVDYEELYKTVRNNNNISDDYKNKVYWFINQIPFIYLEYNYTILNDNLSKAVINENTVKDFIVTLGYSNEYLNELEKTKDYELWNNLCHLLVDSSKYQVEPNKCCGGSIYEGMANYLSKKYFNTKSYPILSNYIEALVDIVGEEKMLDIFLKGYASDVILELYKIIPDNEKAKNLIAEMDHYLARTDLNRNLADMLYEYKYTLLTKDLDIEKIRDPKEDAYQMFKFDIILFKLSDDEVLTIKQDYITNYQDKYNTDLMAIYNYYIKQFGKNSYDMPLNYDKKKILNI